MHMDNILTILEPIHLKKYSVLKLLILINLPDPMDLLQPNELKKETF
jgi:hypothetical protein